MVTSPSGDYTATLPRKRMGAAVLLRDHTDRMLIVEPVYKDYWELPGGGVDADESPYDAVVRALKGDSAAATTLGLGAFVAGLIFGIMLTMVVAILSIPPRLTAAGAAAVACVAVSAISALHATLWYEVLAGLALASAGLVVAALLPIARAWRIKQQYWTRPDVALIAALLHFGDCVESDPEPQERRRAVAALDDAATKFELAWNRVNRTGIDVTDRQLRAWASRMRAETRELQRWFALGPPSTLRLLLHTYELIQAIVNRYFLSDHEDDWVQHGSWHRPPTSTLARLWLRIKVSGRYVGQCLLAGLIAVTALFLLADTIWSKVSAFVGTHVSEELGSALNFDPTMRVFVAGISLSLLAVAGRAFARRH